MTGRQLQELLPLVIAVVEKAGRLLFAEWHRPGGPRGEGDKAAIDAQIETELREKLLGLLDCDFWGEETGYVLSKKDCCWVVDPNDGTSDFLKGIKGSAISVGLLRNKLPVLGVVHAPVTEHGEPDTIAWASGDAHLLRNGIAIQPNLSTQVLSPQSVIMVSSAARRKPEINQQLCFPARFHPMPSIAYRLAKVAAGDGICGISLYPVSAHDVVAGHALLIGAFGVLVDESGAPIKYEDEASMLAVSSRCFGGAPLACAALMNRQWHKVFDPDC